MKVMDFSTLPFDGGNLPFKERIQGMMQFGFSWIKEMKSQDKITRGLDRILSNKYTLLQNVTLQETNVKVPLVLVGPHGVNVIYNSPLVGVYQAKAEVWSILDGRSRKFQPTQPNLINRTILMTRGVQTLLANAGYNIEVESVLAFSNPGTHVETQRPAVRVILSDAIENFASRLKQSEPAYSTEDVRLIVDAIVKVSKPEQDSEFSPKAANKPGSAQAIDSKFNQIINPILKKLNFSQRQWILLGAFVLADVLVLITFVIIILSTV